MTRHHRLLEAVGAYGRAIRLQPHDWKLHAELAALFVRQDRLEEAADEFHLALDCGSPDAKVLLDLSLVLARMGRLPEAISAIDRALAAKPNEASFIAVKSELEETAGGKRYAVVGCKFMAVESVTLFEPEEFTAPACIQYTNFTEINPAFALHHLNNLYVEKRRWVPDVQLCRLPGDTALAVPNGEEFIPIAGFQVVAEQIRENWPYQRLAAAIDACTGQQEIPQPAILIGRYGIRTWGHWLGELLPKVVTIEARWPGRFSYILPDRFSYDPVHETAMQSLTYYGIGRDRLILVSSKVKYNCANLHVVTPVWSAGRALHPGVARLLRRRSKARRHQMHEG